MRRPRFRVPVSIAIWFGAVVLLPSIAKAQTGGPYALTWSSIAGGGAMYSTSVSPAYSMGGTIGQTSPGVISGGSYSLIGGFWASVRSALVDVPDSPADIPTKFLVHQNVPNPFSTTTSIAFDLPAEARVTMEVFNLRGERMRVLIDRVMRAGRHSMTWAGIGDDGRPMSPGVYWIRTLANDRRDVRKVVLVK